MIRYFIIVKECTRREKHLSSLNILETSVVPQMVAVSKGTYHVSRVATKNSMAQSYMKNTSFVTRPKEPRSTLVRKLYFERDIQQPDTCTLAYVSRKFIR